VSYEVDVSGWGYSIGATKASNPVTVGLVWPSDIAPYQWYRLSIAIDPPYSGLPGDPPNSTNTGGTLLTIIGEQFGIQEDNQQYSQLTIRNDTDYSKLPGTYPVVTFTLNVVSTPSHY
jgi:hypothetical protein